MRFFVLFLMFCVSSTSAADNLAWLVEGTVGDVRVQDGSPSVFQVGDPVEIRVPLESLTEDLIGFGYDISAPIETRIGDQMISYEFLRLDGNQTLSHLDFTIGPGFDSHIFLTLSNGEFGEVGSLDRFPNAVDLDVDQFEFAFGGFEFLQDTITTVDFQIDFFRVVPEPTSLSSFMTVIVVGLVWIRHHTKSR